MIRSPPRARHSFAQRFIWSDEFDPTGFKPDGKVERSLRTTWLAPALQATRLELVRAIHGELLRDARPSRARNLLVAVQVTGSVLLLICAAVFLRSSWAAAGVDPGILTADTVNVNVMNEQRCGAVLEALRSEPLVVSVAASWPGGLGGRPASADGANGKSTVTYQFVSPEYFGVLGIDLVRGSGFTQTRVEGSK